VAIGFSLSILFLSSTEIGYIPLSPHRTLDLAIIPAVFASMIGGYRIGIPAAIAWAIIAYINPASHLQSYGILGLALSKLAITMTATWAYQWFRRKYEYSPYNVYRATIASVTAKAVIANLVLWIMANHEEIPQTHIRDILKEYALELMLCNLFMVLLIKHLRQVHILNGVRRREKQKREGGK